MKKFLLILFSFISLTAGFAQDILPKPNPPRLVNDAAGVLSPEQVDILERKLVARIRLIRFPPQDVDTLVTTAPYDFLPSG